MVRYRIISEEIAGVGGDRGDGAGRGGGYTMKHFRITLEWDNDEQVFITFSHGIAGVVFFICELDSGISGL